MTNKEAVNWLINLTADIGKSEHHTLWHYEQALYEIRDMLQSLEDKDTNVTSNVPDTNVGDTISRQAAIDALRMDISRIPFAKAREYVREAIDTIYNRLEELPSAQPEPCDLCSCLEKGDTLYQYSDWDGGIGFDYIRDIQFCPRCGRRLK